MKTKIVFEVFRLGKGVGYNSREVLGILTDEEAAKALAKQARAKCSKIHVVFIDEKWHRYYARPLHLNIDLTNNKELEWLNKQAKNSTTQNSSSESTSVNPPPKLQSVTLAT